MKFVIMITIVGALLGGTALYLSTVKSKNINKYFETIVLSLAVSFMVPLFLNTISSNLIDNIIKPSDNSNSSDAFVYFGFVLLASLSPKLFIGKLTSEWLKKIESNQEKTEEKVNNIEKATKEIIMNTDKPISVEEPNYEKTTDILNNQKKFVHELNDNDLRYLFHILNNNKILVSDVHDADVLGISRSILVNVKKKLLDLDLLTVFEIGKDKLYSLTPAGKDMAMEYVNTTEWRVESIQWNRISNYKNIYEIGVFNKLLKHKVIMYTKDKKVGFKEGSKIQIKTVDAIKVDSKYINIIE